MIGENVGLFLGRIDGLVKKVGWAFTIVIVCILPHAEFEPNDYREDATHFILSPLGSHDDNVCQLSFQTKSSMPTT